MINLDVKVAKVLAEYHSRIAQEEELMRSLPMPEGMKRRDEFLLAVGEETGIFLHTLVKAIKPSVILEVGTSYGYSTLWLADAARSYGGKVITLEISSDKSDYARSKINEAGLSDYVESIIGDALQSIEKISSGIDFVLLDIWKELYLPCFNLIYPKLNQGGYIIADNMLSPPAHLHEAEAYRAHIRSLNTFDTILLPLGSGIEMSKLK